VATLLFRMKAPVVLMPQCCVA